MWAYVYLYANAYLYVYGYGGYGYGYGYVLYMFLYMYVHVYIYAYVYVYVHAYVYVRVHVHVHMFIVHGHVYVYVHVSHTPCLLPVRLHMHVSVDECSLMYMTKLSTEASTAVLCSFVHGFEHHHVWLPACRPSRQHECRQPPGCSNRILAGAPGRAAADRGDHGDYENLQDSGSPGDLNPTSVMDAQLRRHSRSLRFGEAGYLGCQELGSHNALLACCSSLQHFPAELSA